MRSSPPRRRRWRAKPLLVAVGTLAIGGAIACVPGVHGVVACRNDGGCGGGGAGGVGGGGGEPLDLAVPTSAPDLKPPSD